MNWEAISAIGEIVGATGLVVTLIYLAVQVRQGTKATHRSGTDLCRPGLSRHDGGLRPTSEHERQGQCVR